MINTIQKKKYQLKTSSEEVRVELLLPPRFIEMKGLLKVIVADFSMAVEKISVKKNNNTMIPD